MGKYIAFLCLLFTGLLPLACSTKNHLVPSGPQTTVNTVTNIPTGTPTFTQTQITTSTFTNTPTITNTPTVTPTSTAENGGFWVYIGTNTYNSQISFSWNVYPSGGPSPYSGSASYTTTGSPSVYLGEQFSDVIPGITTYSITVSGTTCFNSAIGVWAAPAGMSATLGGWDGSVSNPGGTPLLNDSSGSCGTNISGTF